VHGSQLAYAKLNNVKAGERLAAKHLEVEEKFRAQLTRSSVQHGRSY
jgi:hypothetical protein